MKSVICIILYVVAIVAANITVALFGAWVSIANAFLFIGLDLSTRDILHDVWSRGRWWKMGSLIVSGSVLSWLLNRDAGMVAIASCIALACAGIVDSLTYHYLRKYDYLIRCNGSNVAAALVDSIVFPTIAFGGFSLWVTLAQFAAKVNGGFVWSLILRRFDENNITKL